MGEEDIHHWKYEKALIGKRGESNSQLFKLIEEIYPSIEEPLKKIIGGSQHYHVKVKPKKGGAFYVRIWPSGLVSVPLKDPYYGYTPIKTLNGKKILEFNPWQEDNYKQES